MQWAARYSLEMPVLGGSSGGQGGFARAKRMGREGPGCTRSAPLTPPLRGTGSCWEHNPDPNCPLTEAQEAARVLSRQQSRCLVEAQREMAGKRQLAVGACEKLQVHNCKTQHQVQTTHRALALG